MDDLKSWAGLLSVLLSAGAIFYAWLTAPSKKAQGDVDELKKAMQADRAKAQDDRQRQGDAIVARFSVMEARLLKIESDLTHLPDREQTHRLEIAVERLTGRMETLDERLKPVAAVSDRLQEFLLEQAARK